MILLFDSVASSYGEVLPTASAPAMIPCHSSTHLRSPAPPLLLLLLTRLVNCLSATCLSLLLALIALRISPTREAYLESKLRLVDHLLQLRARPALNFDTDVSEHDFDLFEFRAADDGFFDLADDQSHLLSLVDDRMNLKLAKVIPKEIVLGESGSELVEERVGANGRVWEVVEELFVFHAQDSPVAVMREVHVEWVLFREIAADDLTCDLQLIDLVLRLAIGPYFRLVRVCNLA